MKKIIFTFLFACTLTTYSQAQSKTTNQEVAYKAIKTHTLTNKINHIKATSQLPQYPGGKEAMKIFLAEHIQYPELANQNAFEGMVIVQAMVELNGVLSNFKVIRSVNSVLNAAALETIKKMPNWNPAMQLGEAVKCKVNIPVVFSLH